MVYNPKKMDVDRRIWEQSYSQAMRVIHISNACHKFSRIFPAACQLHERSEPFTIVNLNLTPTRSYSSEQDGCSNS